jgi:hypothetical protein
MLAWFHALFKLFALIAVVWLVVVLLLGSRLQVPLWVGVPLTVTAWIVVLVGGYRIFRTLFRRKGGLASAALLADEALPESQERISSAVEIAQERDGRYRGSPELIAVLMRQAEHHADTMDPAVVISGRDVMRWISAAGLVLLVWFVLLVILTPNMLLGMQRMFQPWTAAGPLPEPVLEVSPGDVVKAQGGEVDIKVVVKPPEGVSFDHGQGKVDRATIVQHFLHPNGGVSPDLALAMEPTELTDTRAFHLNFTSLQQSFTYKIVVEGGKDVGHGESKQYTVTVQSRPAVADVEVLYTYPAYTRLNPRTEHSREGAISAVVGTKVRAVIHTTEAVKTAQMVIADDGTGPKTLDLTKVDAGEEATGNGKGEAAYAGEFTLNKSTTYQVKLAKEDGRDNPDAQPRPIRALLDSPPSINIVLPEPKGGRCRCGRRIRCR